jgi:hypothetical protein
LTGQSSCRQCAGRAHRGAVARTSAEQYSGLNSLCPCFR